MQNQLNQKYFSGRPLFIATNHGKEKVLGPLLADALGVQPFTLPGLDTDELGTFSGEVPRRQSAFRTARLKCDLGHRVSGASLVLASEGSFGAHPDIPFAPADEEWLVLKDYEHGLEYSTRLLSLDTNSAAQVCNNWQEVEAFAGRVRFPSHGLIVRQAKEDISEIHKGIRSWEKLAQSFRYFAGRKGSVYVETDMRALHNPTRQKVIGEAGLQLLCTIQTACPLCGTPGFDVVQVVDGLPCDWCATPTPSTKAYVRLCAACHHREEEVFPHQKQKEDPAYCLVCNP